MSYSEKDLETFRKNVLKPEDTFHFECEMCGRCCRNRQEPILITGADLYRIARALDITMMKAVEDNTAGYIGETSHMPVLVLKERLDGSCRLLRKGRCMVHQDKPAVCALYPLGRFYDFRDNSFHYFVNPVTCQPNRKDGKIWTLQEWLDEFKIEETEKMTQAWNRLIGGLTMVTHKMSKDKINGRLLDVLLAALYFSYDTNKPYIKQVEQHMAMLPGVFKNEFGKVLKFDQA